MESKPDALICAKQTESSEHGSTLSVKVTALTRNKRTLTPINDSQCNPPQKSLLNANQTTLHFSPTNPKDDSLCRNL